MCNAQYVSCANHVANLRENEGLTNDKARTYLNWQTRGWDVRRHVFTIRDLCSTAGSCTLQRRWGAAGARRPEYGCGYGYRQVRVRVANADGRFVSTVGMASQRRWWSTLRVES